MSVKILEMSELAIALWTAIYFVRGWEPLRSRFLDVPVERSAHRIPVPRLGGLVLAVVLMGFMLLFHRDFVSEHLWLVGAALSVFGIGMVDDRVHLAARYKLLLIIFAALLLVPNGVVVDHLGIFFRVNITLGWLAIPFTVFAVSGLTNAINLIDGLDGLAASLGLAMLVVFAWIGYRHHDPFMFTVSLYLIVGLAVFLVFNWFPASIFLGDAGSLMIGFVIAILAIKSLAYYSAVSVLFMVLVPVIDTAVVMLRRLRTGRSIFEPDRCHTHHIVKVFFQGSSPHTALILGTLQLIYGLTGLYLNPHADEGIPLLLILLNIALVYLFSNAMIRWEKREC
jgi:UDP-GlcNAc:undecaprenyl-phosphate GlcNAc-1-phosphate transferase